jgi:hypothetical protein
MFRAIGSGPDEEANLDTAMIRASHNPILPNALLRLTNQLKPMQP